MSVVGGLYNISTVNLQEDLAKQFPNHDDNSPDLQSRLVLHTFVLSIKYFFLISFVNVLIKARSFTTRVHAQLLWCDRFAVISIARGM